MTNHVKKCTFGGVVNQIHRIYSTKHRIRLQCSFEQHILCNYLKKGQTVGSSELNNNKCYNYFMASESKHLILKRK